jgi:hypothetical protein
VEDERAIRAEMRLWALEVLVCNLLVMLCASDSDPQAAFELVRQGMIAGAGQRTFPEVADPALSDLYAAELQVAVTRLMEMGRTQMRSGLGGVARS